MKKILTWVFISIVLIFIYFINHYNLSVVCNSKGNYCSWFYTTITSVDLTEEEYMLYNAFEDTSISSMYWFYKLVVTEPLFILKKIFLWLFFSIILYLTYFWYLKLLSKIEKNEIR